MWFHDESCYHAMEFKTKMFLEAGQQSIPKKNVRGRLIHISDLIGPEGILGVRNEDGEMVRYARKIIYPGKNGDPWWGTKQLVEQMKDVINIFEEAFPGCIGVFIFDQSSAHQSHGDGALNAFCMNVNDGGKAPVQNDIYYPPESRGLASVYRGESQELYIWKDGAKEPKGIKTVLRERGCLPEGALPKGKRQPRCPDTPKYPSEAPICCLARILQNHKDFREQKSLLEQSIKDRGHVCVFLPKFHCELNPIEMYWGYGKQRYRQVPKSSFEHAKEVPKSLNACTRHFEEVLQPLLQVHGCIPKRAQRKGCSMMCKKTEGS
jgi:hypothetical protein